MHCSCACACSAAVLTVLHAYCAGNAYHIGVYIRTHFTWFPDVRARSADAKARSAAWDLAHALDRALDRALKTARALPARVVARAVARAVACAVSCTARSFSRSLFRSCTISTWQGFINPLHTMLCLNRPILECRVTLSLQLARVIMRPSCTFCTWASILLDVQPGEMTRTIVCSSRSLTRTL